MALRLCPTFEKLFCGVNVQHRVQNSYMKSTPSNIGLFILLVNISGSFEGQVFEDVEVEFCVQENEVISALNLVLPLMNLGEKCEIITDPEFAYGQFLKLLHLIQVNRSRYLYQ